MRVVFVLLSKLLMDKVRYGQQFPSTRARYNRTIGCMGLLSFPPHPTRPVGDSYAGMEQWHDVFFSTISIIIPGTLMAAFHRRIG